MIHICTRRNKRIIPKIRLGRSRARRGADRLKRSVGGVQNAGKPSVLVSVILGKMSRTIEARVVGVNVCGSRLKLQYFTITGFDISKQLPVPASVKLVKTGGTVHHIPRLVFCLVHSGCSSDRSTSTRPSHTQQRRFHTWRTRHVQ